MYEEIIKLKAYCDKIGVIAKLEYFPQYYGYMIMFKNGGDCFQHNSYDNENNIVVFGNTGSRIDNKATTLENAKAFVKRNKAKLNKGEQAKR